MDAPRILVSVVNYCDPEFYDTVKSLWDNAFYKNSIYFSLVSEDFKKFDFSFIPKKQLVYKHYSPTKYHGGLCWARNLAVDVDFDYDYFYQFDSHTVAFVGWDKKGIDAFNSIKDDKYIVSYGPATYEYGKGGRLVFNVEPTMPMIAEPTKIAPGFQFPGYVPMKLKEVREGFWVTCCYLLTPKKWVDEVGIPKDSSFNTEEFNLSLNTHHAGWKVFGFGGKEIFHHISHKQKDGVVTRETYRPWADERKEAYWDHVERATVELSKTISGQGSIPLKSVESFFIKAGISFNYLKYNPDYLNHIVLDNRPHGMPPRRFN